MEATIHDLSYIVGYYKDNNGKPKAIKHRSDLTVIDNREARFRESYIDRYCTVHLTYVTKDGLDLKVQIPKHRKHSVFFIGGRSFVVQPKDYDSTLKMLGC